MASQAQISPNDHNGQDRDLQLPLVDLNLHRLLGHIFKSCCPPDVQPNTRIIGLCGIADGLAPEDSSPEPAKTPASSHSKPIAIDHSSWHFGKLRIKETISRKFNLFSTSCRKKRRLAKEAKEFLRMGPGQASPRNDGWFFSDFYLFHHLFRDAGANQLWVTCEEPNKLVQKYGDSLEDAYGGFAHLNTPTDLLEDFLKTFRSECEIAAENDQAVLLLIFGHGDFASYGVRVGLKGSKTKTHPVLHVDAVRQILQSIKKKVNITTLTTSCYSGGWLYHSQLNDAGAAAASPAGESKLWSGAIGSRCQGSFWDTAVTRSFIKMEDSRLADSRPSVEIKEWEISSSSTWFKLCSVIGEALSREVDLCALQHQISFSAKDDAWESEWKPRSGIPLVQLQKQWRSLRLAKVGLSAHTGSHKPTRTSTSSTKYGPGHFGVKNTITKSAAENIVRSLAETYMGSNPGQNNMAPNTALHSCARMLISGERLSNSMIAYAHENLLYRVTCISQATYYKKLLGLDFPDCEDWDYMTWLATPTGQSVGLHIGPIMDAGLFPPSPHLTYLKPLRYLAAALGCNGKTEKEIEEIVAQLARMREVHDIMLTDRIRNDPSVRQTAAEAFNSLGKRLRSPSPTDRGTR